MVRNTLPLVKTQMLQRCQSIIVILNQISTESDERYQAVNVAIEGGTMSRCPSILQRLQLHIGLFQLDQPLEQLGAATASSHVKQMSPGNVLVLVAIVALIGGTYESVGVACLRHNVG